MFDDEDQLICRNNERGEPFGYGKKIRLKLKKPKNKNRQCAECVFHDKEMDSCRNSDKDFMECYLLCWVFDKS